jgi:YcxB-like protein
VKTSSQLEAGIPFRGEITQFDFARAQSLLLPKWATAYVIVPLCLFLFIHLGIGWSATFQNPLSALPDLLFAFAVIAAYWAITWFGRRRAWQADAQMHGQTYGLLSPVGLEWNTEITSTKLPWNKLLRFKEVKDLVLIYYSPHCAFYFPRSFFSSEESWGSFKKLLALHFHKSA